MKNIKIKGETEANVGETQGFIGISIRRDTMRFQEQTHNVVHICYELEPGERERILKGEPIRLTLLGYGIQPHILQVGDTFD